MSLSKDIVAIIGAIKEIPMYETLGKVISINNTHIECEGLERFVSIGSICSIANIDKKSLLFEVVKINQHSIIIIPIHNAENITINCSVKLEKSRNSINPDINWLGSVINGLGNDIDGQYLKPGKTEYNLTHNKSHAHGIRNKIKNGIDIGIKSLNAFCPFCTGQRMGIFAGSGVGKSILLSMIAKHAKSDVKIVGLIGERGREIKEFIDSLSEEDRKNTIIVAATNDESSTMKKRAAYLTLTLSEYFRDQGMHVICMIDSITRFAMAQREIGLISREIPTNKGYTPSVFVELAKLLERAGPGYDNNQGNITGIFTVLVEGDDTNEPISDAVRGILDGHIILDRKIAERNIFPAINILNSISRASSIYYTQEEENIINKIKKYLSLYRDNEDLIKLGAYNEENSEISCAIKTKLEIEDFIKQSPECNAHSRENCFKELINIMNNNV